MCLPDGYAGAAACTVVAPGGAGKYAAESQGVGAAAKKAYRRAQDTRAIRKNVTIPSYLNDLAERAGVNFSQVLQDGLRQRLGVQ